MTGEPPPDADDDYMTPQEQLDMVKPVADRLMVQPLAFLMAVKAASLTRRGSTQWSNHDMDLAESCIGAFLAAAR